MKLSSPQTKLLLSLLERRPQRIAFYYPPLKRLVELGLAVEGRHGYMLTPEGIKIATGIKTNAL